MGGRDHSEICETCGYPSGGLDDLLCACQYNGIKDATPDSPVMPDRDAMIERGT